MEITGWDTVIFTTTPPRAVFARVAVAVLARWPAALVEGLGLAETGQQPLADISAEQFPTGPGHPIFYRDAVMVRHMEKVAYAPMADGDGPFAVITRERRDVVFTVAELDERWAADHTPGGLQPPLPYPAWLCSPLLIEVTTVTPGAPASQEFSSWVLAEVRRACSPDADHSGVSPNLNQKGEDEDG